LNAVHIESMIDGVTSDLILARPFNKRDKGKKQVTLWVLA